MHNFYPRYQKWKKSGKNQREIDSLLVDQNQPSRLFGAGRRRLRFTKNFAESRWSTASEFWDLGSTWTDYRSRPRFDFSQLIKRTRTKRENQNLRRRKKIVTRLTVFFLYRFFILDPIFKSLQAPVVVQINGFQCQTNASNIKPAEKKTKG